MTPFNQCPTKPNTLCLHVTECSCTCGNRWTHSYPLHYGNGHYGGTPTPKEESERSLARVTQASRNFAHCFRCIPLGTPVGWQAAAKPTKPPAKPPSPSLASLEEGIF